MAAAHFGTLPEPSDSAAGKYVAGAGSGGATGGHDAPANAGSDGEPKPMRVLVKVGDGKDSLFKSADLMNMDRMELLKALAKDDGFRESLAGVKLDKSTVSVVTSTSKVPSAADEGAAVELTADDTLQGYVDKLAEDAKAPLPEGTKLFIRVQLPGALLAEGEAAVIQLFSGCPCSCGNICTCLYP